MSDEIRLSLFVPFPELEEEDEVDQVLAVLRKLQASVINPVVRACLEEAHDDIAHLMSRDDEMAGTEDKSAAA